MNNHMKKMKNTFNKIKFKLVIKINKKAILIMYNTLKIFIPILVNNI